MANETSVLLIFEHDLLGEGLAARLATMGIHALTARACDDDAIVAGLSAGPEVVVVECRTEGCLDRIRRLSPGSRVVDATGSIGRGYPTEAMRFEVILDALGINPQQETPA